MRMNTSHPANETEVADAVREAAEKGSSFEIVANGTKREFGRPVSATTILNVSALSGIMKYEPEELVLTARAATPPVPSSTTRPSARRIMRSQRCARP